jgi:hypothetical protein
MSPLTSVPGITEEEYEQPLMPKGFVFQFSLLNTWGDRYYLGLNGIELHDEFGDLIPLTAESKLKMFFDIKKLVTFKDIHNTC